MITEDYVSFEIAKLLKEKGFDEQLCHFYTEEGLPIMYKTKEGFVWANNSKSEHAITQPTLQMAMKWLREVHNLHCCSDYDSVLGWYCQITSLNETVEYDNLEMKHYHPDKDNSFSSPEEAYEAAIKHCLENLI